MRAVTTHTHTHGKSLRDASTRTTSAILRPTRARAHLRRPPAGASDAATTVTQRSQLAGNEWPRLWRDRQPPSGAPTVRPHSTTRPASPRVDNTNLCGMGTRRGTAGCKRTQVGLMGEELQLCSSRRKRAAIWNQEMDVCLVSCRVCLCRDYFKRCYLQMWKWMAIEDEKTNTLFLRISHVSRDLTKQSCHIRYT